MMLPRQTVTTPAASTEPSGAAWSLGQEWGPLGCNCRGPDQAVSMTDTQLTVVCEVNVSCTGLNVEPGATIVSPILLSLSGVTGQIWALYYLYTTTRPQHSRTVFFLLLSTLIWTDLVGKLLTTGPALAAYVHGEWVGGVPLCNFHAFSMMLISMVTHLLVATMAVERFIGIRHGYFYNKNITTSRTKLLLLGIWLFSVLFCALPLFGVGQYALQYPGSWCFVNLHVQAGVTPLHHLLYTNLFGCLTLANLVIMVVCNIVVIIILLEKAIARRDDCCQATLLCLRLCRQRCWGTTTTTVCAPHRSYRQRELEMQMVIVLLVITIVFCISWSPFDMRLFLNQLFPHETRADHIQDLIAVRLTSINQIIDPWAYIICRKVFQTRVWQWMRISVMGSRLLGRESSLQQTGGGVKRPSRTARALEKITYRTPYKGDRVVEREGPGEDSKGVVVVVEEDATYLPPSPEPDPPAASPPPAAAADALRDSGTGSNNTVDTESPGPVVKAAGPEVPIPVFRSQQYRVCSLGDHHHLYHLTRHRRLTSSASARSASRPPSHPPDGSCEEASSPPSSCLVPGRRHSWCCPNDAAEAKHFRTQSTQTLEPPDPPPNLAASYQPDLLHPYQYLLPPPTARPSYHNSYHDHNQTSQHDPLSYNDLSQHHSHQNTQNNGSQTTQHDPFPYSPHLYHDPFTHDGSQPDPHSPLTNHSQANRTQLDPPPLLTNNARDVHINVPADHDPDDDSVFTVGETVTRWLEVAPHRYTREGPLHSAPAAAAGPEQRRARHNLHLHTKHDEDDLESRITYGAFVNPGAG